MSFLDGIRAWAEGFLSDTGEQVGSGLQDATGQVGEVGGQVEEVASQATEQAEGFQDGVLPGDEQNKPGGQ